MNTGEWPQYSVMLWHCKILLRDYVSLLAVQSSIHVSSKNVLPAHDHDLLEDLGSQACTAGQVGNLVHKFDRVGPARRHRLLHVVGAVDKVSDTVVCWVSDVGHTDVSQTSMPCIQTQTTPDSKVLPAFNGHTKSVVGRGRLVQGTQDKVKERQVHHARCPDFCHHCSGCGSSLEVRRQRYSRVG